jgi:hypothetical protein
LDCEALLREAQRLLASGLQTAAADILVEYLSANEAEPAVLQMLARVRMLQGRASDAVTLLKQALKLHRDRSQPNSLPQPASFRTTPRDSELTAPFVSTDSDEDWQLIAEIAAERRERRRLFDPEEQQVERPQAPKFSERRLPPAPTAEPETNSQCHDDPTPPPQDPTFDLVQPSRERICAPQQPTARAPRSEGPKRTETHQVGLSSIQRQFDFEFADDDAEDEDQRQSEEMLDASAEPASLGDEAEEHVLDTDALEPDAELSGSEEPPGLDWDEFALDADDFDEAPTREELVAVQSEGRLTRSQRARQQAIDLGLEYDWDEDGVDVLTEVFTRYWWSQCKESMRRELQAGLRPNELQLALQLREIWSSHPEFAMDFGRLNGSTLLGTTSPVYRNLSWPMALALVRSTERYPDIDCLEQLLCDLFDEWYTHSHLRRRCKSFNLFLYFRLGLARQELRAWPQWTFEPEDMLGLETDDDHRPGFCTPEYQVLNQLGLIPKVHTTPPKRDKPQGHCAPHSARTEEPAATPGNGEESQSRVAFDGSRITSASGAVPPRDKAPERRAGFARKVAEADS